MIRQSLITLSILMMGPALAHADSFAGAWATDLAACKVPQEREGAPILLTPKGYDQYETHCTFKVVMQKGRTFTADASCSVQGDNQTAEIVMVVAANGKSMTMAHDGGPDIALQRCR